MDEAEVTEWLQPKIHTILTAPGVDLAVISGKKVRKALLEMEVEHGFIKEHKSEIDILIAAEFELVASAAASVTGHASSETPEEREPSPTPAKRKRVKTEDAAESDQETKPSKKKKATKVPKAEVTDAELARQLSMEINGRPSRSGRGSTSTPTLKPTPKKSRANKKVKSAEMISDSDEEGGGEDGEPSSAPAKKKRTAPAGGAFNKEFVLSPPLAAVLGVDKLSRPQTVKQLWVYIKSNNLQNPKNGREIICDEGGLREVFGGGFPPTIRTEGLNSSLTISWNDNDAYRDLPGAKVDMFTMNKKLGEHLYPNDQ